MRTMSKCCEAEFRKDGRKPQVSSDHRDCLDDFCWMKTSCCFCRLAFRQQSLNRLQVPISIFKILMSWRYMTSLSHWLDRYSWFHIMCQALWDVLSSFIFSLSSWAHGSISKNLLILILKYSILYIILYLIKSLYL